MKSPHEIARLIQDATRRDLKSVHLTHDEIAELVFDRVKTAIEARDAEHRAARRSSL